MPDLFILIAALGLAALVAVLLWPGRGILARVARMRRESERVRLEDGLKHLLDCERAGRIATLETTAGRLETSRGDASDVLTRLADRGLAVVSRRGWELTGPGRAYALRILRTHRLWERYLADRTGVPARDWHRRAERVEHQLTEEEADRLAWRLGDPRYDPHGDPIPTAGGEIPDRAGVSLGRADVGQRLVVRHLEDEPAEVFDRLVEVGLAPGVALEVVATSGEPGAGRIRIRVRGEEYTLRAVDAGNVTVEPLPEGAEVPEGRRTLADATRGEEVRVARIAPECQGPQRRRLLDLGVVPGTEIVPELRSAAGDPVAYRIRGALIALRREQAEWIELESEPESLERAG
jgi:DtxR family Mn-dependent transcriptional regulator